MSDAGAQTQPPAGVDDLEAVARDLAEVEGALGRLDEPPPGRCVVCGVGLDADVVANDPSVLTCPRHS